MLLGSAGAGNGPSSHCPPCARPSRMEAEEHAKSLVKPNFFSRHVRVTAHCPNTCPGAAGGMKSAAFNKTESKRETEALPDTSCLPKRQGCLQQLCPWCTRTSLHTLLNTSKPTQQSKDPTRCLGKGRNPVPPLPADL